MYCMKCAREIRSDQVFCEDCLAGMEKEPVRIDMPVTLPVPPPRRSSTYRRPAVKPEEEIRRLRKVNRKLKLTIFLLVVLLLIVVVHGEDLWALLDQTGWSRQRILP